MNITNYPHHVQEYISALISNGALYEDALTDKTFINYLYTQKFDKDYIDSMLHDR